MTLRELSLPVKVLFSCFLITIGVGYLFAITYLYLMDLEPHTKHGDSVLESVILKFYGNRGTSKLEAALNGIMSVHITPSQKKEVFDWIRNGATESGFAAVQPIFLDTCAKCHSKESGMSIPPLTTYEEVTAYTQVDMGESFRSLVRVSHIHLFGMSFIFLLTGGIFVLSEVKLWWRALLVAIPFASIWMDIGSWWFTKLQPVFAYTVIIGGGLMGLALASQIFLSLYEMWLKKAHDEKVA